MHTLSLCRGHSLGVRLAKQETLTPPGTWSHLWFAGVRECPPWCSVIGATVTVHQFFCILYWKSFMVGTGILSNNTKLFTHECLMIFCSLTGCSGIPPPIGLFAGPWPKNLSYFFWTIHFEHPSVLSRFCCRFYNWTHTRMFFFLIYKVILKCFYAGSIDEMRVCSLLNIQAQQAHTSMVSIFFLPPDKLSKQLWEAILFFSHWKPVKRRAMLIKQIFYLRKLPKTIFS